MLWAPPAPPAPPQCIPGVFIEGAEEVGCLGGSRGSPHQQLPHACPIPAVFQTVSINKAINAQEVAVKEKHARNILLLLEKGARLC